MTNLFKFITHAPQFFVTWAIFFGCGVVTYTIYALRHDRKFAFRELYEHCIPINIFTDPSFHADLKIYVVGKFIEGFLAVPAIAIGVWLCGRLSGALSGVFPSHSPLEFTVLSASVCTIVAFVAVEFADYAYHWTSHKVQFLWELHKLHHSAQSLNPLTSKRGHPLDLALGNFCRSVLSAIPGGVFVFLYGISIAEATVLSIVASRIFVIATLDPLKHSHHPISLGFFDRLLISPHMHQIHHSKNEPHWDKNFGTNLSVFDWIFGTAYKPGRGEKAVYGVSGLSEATLLAYNTMGGAYIRPLAKSYSKFKRLLVAAAPLKSNPNPSGESGVDFAEAGRTPSHPS